MLGSNCWCDHVVIQIAAGNSKKDYILISLGYDGSCVVCSHVHATVCECEMQLNAYDRIAYAGCSAGVHVHV